MDKEPTLTELSQGIYRRGSPSPLVRSLGNPHLDIRRLRQALYSRKNIIGSVIEIFPIWSEKDNQVKWTEDTVTPDKSLDDLLDYPEKAMEVLFPKSSLLRPDGVSKFDWQNHLYAIHSIVYELCALANRNGTNFLKMFEPKLIEFQSISKAPKQGVIKDRPSKTPKDLPSKTPKDLPSKTPKDLPSKTSKELPSKPTKDLPSKTPKDLPSKTSKDLPSKTSEDLPLAYKFTCKYCKGIKEISGKEVLFYQKKGFQMPKQCKACKQANSKKKLSKPIPNTLKYPVIYSSNTGSDDTLRVLDKMTKNLVYEKSFS
jgi:hypothetical protein